MLTILASLLRPDLVWICNGSPWLVDNAIALRRLFAGIPIIDQQVYDTTFGWIEHYDRKGLQSFDHFIAINAGIGEKFVRQLRIPAHRVSLIYSAVNAARLKASRVAPENIAAERVKMGLSDRAPRIFAFIARLTAQKRPLVFLELARRAQLAGSTDQFVFVGDGDLRPQCAEFIREHGLANVLAMPFSSQTPRLLAVTDGLILPSEYEGLPIVMLEALAVGTPTLATDVGDIRRILEEYSAGRVFPVAADDAAVERIFAEWSDGLPEYRRKAQAARDAALERFASATIAAAYRQCFEASMRNGGATGRTGHR